MNGTARKVGSLIEQALKDSELRYRRLFETAQDGVLILDAATGMIEDVNPYLIKMLGYSREEFVEKKLWEVGAFKDIEASQDAFEALQENEYIRYEDLPLKAKDGRLIQVEFVSNVYLVGNKKVIQCNIRDITARKRAEEALQASQLINNGIINAIPVRVFWKDKNLVYLGCNAVFARDAGFSDPKDVIGKDDYQMGWRDQAELYRRDDREVLESGRSKLLVEEPQATPDGNIITLLTSKVPLRGSKDEVIGVLGTYTDITERKQAEDALLKSEERYRLLVETLPDGVIVHSRGRVVFANPASAAIIGTSSPTDLTGKSVMEYVHPDYRELALKRIQQSLREGVPLPLVEEKFLRLDGTPIDVEVSAIPFSYAGNPAMLTVFNDITGRKRAEEALRLSEEKYRTLVDEVNDGFYVTDGTGVFTFANSALARMYGVETPQELVGRKFSDFAAPEVPADLGEAYHSAMETGRTLEVINGQIVRPDGTRVFIEIKPAMMIEGGQVVGTRGVVRDITERKQAERSVAESEKRYRTALNNMMEGCQIIDYDWRYIYINDAAAKQGRKAPEELLMHSMMDAYPGIEDTDLFHKMQLVMENRIPQHAENQFFFSDGTSGLFDLSIQPVPEGIFILSIDLTEREQGVEALLASEAKFRSYNENAPLGIFVVDKMGRYIEVNTAATKMLGYTESELLHLSIPDVLAPLSVEAGLQQFQKVVQDGFATAEFIFSHKDGTQFPATVLA